MARQKVSFMPNWIWREVVAVLVIKPAVELATPFENTIALGVPKLG